MKKRILIIYYSYSSQTRNLVTSFVEGLERQDVEVTVEQLKPVRKLSFPLGSMLSTLVMMVETFFRKREPISPIGLDVTKKYDLIVLAGPTWSYNPSGPMLAFFDKYSQQFAHHTVLPFISCRGYWRMHYYQLKYMLHRSKAKVLKPVVFLHTGPEPWRTIGVFLKLAGHVPESGNSIVSKYYHKFGHTREQVRFSGIIGEKIGNLLINDGSVDQIFFEPVRGMDESRVRKVRPAGKERNNKKSAD